jgi:hypothetical protein
MNVVPTTATATNYVSTHTLATTALAVTVINWMAVSNAQQKRSLVISLSVVDFARAKWPQVFTAQ